MDLEKIKPRIVEASDIDARGLLRPLLLFKGNMSDGRCRAMWNLVVTMMDANIPSVTEAIKTGRMEDYRHLCGLHANPQHMTLNSIIGRLRARPTVASLIPGLREYAEHLAYSSGATAYTLDPIPELTLWKTKRPWRVMPHELRPHRPRKARAPHEVPLDLYPYISNPTSEHELLLAVDAVVPKALPNDVRCDVCQDMIVAVLSGETNVENLRGDTGKYLRSFWKMFPEKYGHVSLDGVVPGTDSMKWVDRLSAKTGRLI